MTTEKALVKADPFSLMDYLDDIQIVQEIKGVVLKEWVYSFPMGGKVVEGLSKAGVDACAAELARKRGEVLREIDFSLIQNDDNVIATIKAGRFIVSHDGHEVMLETVFGVKVQSRKMTIYKRDADGYMLYDSDGHALSHLEDDPFVVEKALMKAARNAKKRLLPMDLQQAIILQARAEPGRVGTMEGDSKSAAAPICPEHKKPMSKGKYGWYCKTKVGDGWCKYKLSAEGETTTGEAKAPGTTKREAGVAEAAEGLGIPPGEPTTDNRTDRPAASPAKPVVEITLEAILAKAAKFNWSKEKLQEQIKPKGFDLDNLTSEQKAKVWAWLNMQGTL